MAVSKVAPFEPSNDPERPNVVWAPSPGDRQKWVKLFANPETLRQLLDDNINAKIGEYCGLVHGNVPNGAVRGLIDTVALFRGLMRPRIDQWGDEAIYIYVTTPPCSFTYPYETRFTADGPTRVGAPLQSIFTTYVEFGTKVLEREKEPIQAGGEDDVRGIVHYWEWTLCSDDDSTLPRDYENRYLERLW